MATGTVYVTGGGSNWADHDYTLLQASQSPAYSPGDSEPTDAISCDGLDDGETTTYTCGVPSLEDITNVSVTYYGISEEGGSNSVIMLTGVNINGTGTVWSAGTDIANNWGDDGDGLQTITENFSTPPSPGDWDGTCTSVSLSFQCEASMTSREAAWIDYVEVTLTGSEPSAGGGGSVTVIRINPEIMNHFLGGGVEFMALREYGVATTIDTGIRVAGESDLATTSDWTPASGDVKVSKDGGSLTNITTLPSFSSGTNLEIDLSATEMEAARVTVHIVDQDATKVVDDMVVVIETYGNASSEHPTLPVDVIEVSGSSTAADNLETYATSEFPADVTKISGDATAADNMEAFYEGCLTTGTVSSGTTSEEIRTSLTEGDDFWNDNVILFTSGTYATKAKRILDYSNTNGACTVSALTGAPSPGDKFVILGVIE